MKEIIEKIESDFSNRVKLVQKRPGIYQLCIPIYHEDGDMIELYLSQKGKGKYSISDFGQTLMRLSYSYDIDTDNKEAILQKIVSENKMIESDGNIQLETTIQNVFTDIMRAAQTYAKIGSMRYFKREVIENLFYEILDEFITTELIEFKPQKKV